MTRCTVLYLLLLLAIQLNSVAIAQTSYPMLMSLSPVAVGVGQTTEVTVRSRYSMRGAFQVLISGEGVSAEIVPPEEDPSADPKTAKPLETLRLRVSAAPDAELGIRDVRIITPTGASTVGQLVVVGDPVVVEQGDNNSLETANPISVPCTVCGAIEKPEDVDLYRFSVEAGKTLIFHTWAMRLEDRIHDLQQHVDPIVVLRDALGNTVAQADNSFAADPLLAYTFSHSGDYFLEVRDVRYQGNVHWVYAVEVTNRPLALVAHPLAVAHGATTSVQAVGVAVPSEPISVTVPADHPVGAWRLSRPFGVPTHPLRLYVSESPVTVETQDASSDPHDAPVVVVPGVIAGCLASEGDIDLYGIQVPKGQGLLIELIAQRLGSAMDGHIRVLDAQGRQLAIADDAREGRRTTRDARLDSWTAPNDGVFFVEVRDVHLRGSPQMPYVLRVEPAAPSFRLYLDTDKTLLAPGAAGILFVRAERINGFDGPIDLNVEGLPAGVSAACGRILPGKHQDACIVFEAAPDAPAGASHIRVLGKALIPGTPEPHELIVPAVPYQEIYLPGGGRGHWPVEHHTVAITQPADIRAITVSTDHVVLKPGQSARIDVHLERAEGFDKNVTLDVKFQHLNTIYGNPLPTGVSLDPKQSKTLLTGAESDGYITLVADKDAPAVDKQQFAVMAHVSINFVMKYTYSSRPIYVTVEPAAP